MEYRWRNITGFCRDIFRCGSNVRSTLKNVKYVYLTVSPDRDIIEI